MKTLFNKSAGLILACSFALIIHQSGFAQDRESAAGEFWQRAAEAFNNERFYEASENFTRFLELQPDHLEALEYRGRAYFLTNKPNEALSDFSRVIELAPDKGQIYLFRGTIYQMGGMCKEASLDFKKGCELGEKAACEQTCDPTKQLMEQALIHYKEENYEEANRLLTQVLNHQPNHELAWYYRAHAFFYTGKYQEALRDITKAINLKPDDRDNWQARARIHEKLNQYDKAIFDYSTALKSAVAFGDLTGDHEAAISILTDRALLYQRRGNCEKSNADFKLACIYRASGFEPCNIAWCGESITSQKNHEALIVKTSSLLRKFKPIVQKMEVDLNSEFRSSGYNQEKMNRFLEYKAKNYQVYIYRYAGLLNDYGSKYPNDVFRVVKNTKW